VWFGSGGWEVSIGWGWWNKFSVENQQYMQNFWYNDSFVFMILLLKCHLWLEKGLDEGSDFSLGTCDDYVPS
jgi:hypothetical protein